MILKILICAGIIGFASLTPSHAGQFSTDLLFKPGQNGISRPKCLSYAPVPDEIVGLLLPVLWLQVGRAGANV